MPKGTSDAPKVVGLQPLDRVELKIRVVSTTPLIVNRWSEKSREMMLQAQQTKARKPKAPKDPEALYEASKYKLADGRDGFPATGFKAAIVHAARLFDGVTQVHLKTIIRVYGEGKDQLVPLEYGEVTMREDTPRNAGGTADLRYRAQYDPWSAVLNIEYIDGQIDEQSLLALVDAAGVGGVGEWRPTAPKSATGTYGCFEAHPIGATAAA